MLVGPLVYRLQAVFGHHENGCPFCLMYNYYGYILTQIHIRGELWRR
jgi:hypothetical protein